ncbi:TonB-dependent receptor plug domain-containing protein [Kriegella sp. EG-1]|nr:TonB-dependent receptor plug domain-containing protein [Flavobacteriaceae bacterium EG-1]
MPKICRNYCIGRLLVLLAFLFLQTAKGQEDIAPRIYFTSYLQELERKFEIKFSYTDASISSIEIVPPSEVTIEGIINNLYLQTQISIEKLDERYYALIAKSNIDICATILDNFQQNTVTGATVQVLESEKATITDLNGKFTLKNIPRFAVIQIKHIGYKTLFITAEKLANLQNCSTLLLTTNYQQLNEVIVYKFLTKGISKQSDASINLNPANFGILPGQIEPDVLQTIQALPGIKSIDETVSEINIRGGTNDQNLILWNNIKMYQSGHFFGLISAFNPYLTNEVSVVKNGTSAAYGGGVSGIINMHTKNTIEETFTGGAGINLINADIYAHLPITNKLGFQFSVRRSLTDFFDTGTYGRFRDRVFQDSDVIESDENFYFYDFTTKVIYNINENQKLRFSLINTNNKLDYSEVNTMSSSNTNSILNQYNLSFGANLESKWTKVFTTKLNIYQSQYRLNARNTAINNGVQQLFQNNKVLENTAKLTTNYSFNSYINWINGYEFNETGILNETFVNQPRFESNILDVLLKNAVFSELNFNSDDQKWIARIGGRFTHFNNLDTFKEWVIEPRLNINYQFTPDFNLELKGEFKSQAINQIIDLEQNFFGIEKRRWILSDGTTLPLTKSKQASIGINYDVENLYVGIDAFYKQVDGISTATQGFQNEDQFNGQIGMYEIKGAEFLINKRAEEFSAWLSYTYTLNNYNFDGIVPPNFPNNLDVKHNLTLAGSYMANNFKISAGINYRSGKPFTEPDTNNPINNSFFPVSINYQNANSSRLPNYFRADASAIYNFNSNGKLKPSLGISVLNFTNRINLLDSYYRIDGSGEIETIESKSLGLTPNINFRVLF